MTMGVVHEVPVDNEMVPGRALQVGAASTRYWHSVAVPQEEDTERMVCQLA